ncbi:protein Shroom1 [Lissotriton helveticus]
MPMASIEKELERWNLHETGGIAKLLHPMGSNYTSRLSPVKSISSIDHLLQFPGKADSAYSSFSGGSTLPDYHSSPLYNAHYCLPPAQLSYMDSEYVRAIYSPNILNSELNDLYPLKSVDINRLNSSENISKVNVGGQCESSPLLDSLEKCPSPRPPPLPPLPNPPTPPARLDSYKTRRTFDKPKDSGALLNQRESKAIRGNITYSYVSTCNTKGRCFQDSWNPQQKNQSLQDRAEERDLDDSETKDTRSACTKQASVILQESLPSSGVSRTDRPLYTQNAVLNYYALGPLNSKASHPAHSSHKVNDLPESKQYFYLSNVHKQTFRGVDQPGSASDSKVHASAFPMNRPDALLENHSEQDENVPQSTASLKYANRLPQRESMSDRVCGLANDSHLQSKGTGGDGPYYTSTEGTSKDRREIPQNAASKSYHPPHYPSVGAPEHGTVLHEEPEICGKRLSNKSNQIFYCGPKSEPSLLTSSAFKSENQSDESGRNLHLKTDGEVTSESTIHKAQLDAQPLKPHPLCDLTSEKITKEKTPMLYHLASGRHAQMAAILSLQKQTPQHEVLEKAPKTISQSTPVSTTEGTDMKRESKPSHNMKDHQNEVIGGNTAYRHGNEKMPLSPPTSLDDSFMNDYREKLKTAQKKVLRETSFKRRDLQMSLPIRLKVTTPKRPGIEHFKSLSLTNASDDAGFTPLSGALGSSNASKNEETKKPLISRIGGRKRQTKEEKKLYHSEPEKLDQLGILQDPRPLRKGDSTGMVSCERTEAGLTTSRKLATENRERACSASSLSKTELKQIQHTALIQYIERKTSQKSTSIQQIPLHKPTQRLSPGRRHSEWSSYPSSNQTTLHAEGSLQPSAPGRSLESSCLHASSYDVPEYRTERLAPEVTPPKAQPLARESDLSNTGHSPLAEHIVQLEEHPSTKSRERIKSALPIQISPRSSAFTVFAHNSDMNTKVGSLAASEEGIDRFFSGKQSVCSIRGRGKSMEEIGTSETVQLSLLSLSTDQLHRKEDQGVSPVLCPPLAKPATAENYEISLEHSPEKRDEFLPRHTTSEDTVGLCSLDLRNSAFQRYSRTIQPCGTISNADASPLVAPSAACVPQASELDPGTPSQFLQTNSVVEEDDVFLKDSSPNMEIPLDTPHQFHTHAAELCLKSADYSRVSPNQLSCLITTVDERAAVGHTPSTPLSKEHSEVQPEIYTDQTAVSSKDMNAKTTLMVSEEENRNNPLNPVPNADETLVGSQEPHIGTTDAVISQESEVCSQSIPSLQVGHDQNGTNRDSELKVSESMEHDSAAVEKIIAVSPVKVKSPEDQRCEVLAQEIIAKDQSLVDILDPNPLRKTAVDLMEGLFPVDMSLLNQSRSEKKNKNKNRSQKSNDEEKAEGPMETSPKPVTPLRRYQAQTTEGESWKEPDDITYKKVELVSNIQAKLQRLRKDHQLLLSDVEENSGYGTELEALVKKVCKSNEYDRYMMFIGDLEKVVNLLLCLSMRLARVENALSKVNQYTDIEEKHSLNERYNLLSRQREDAKDLKENLDRREKVVSDILAKYLSEQQLQEYRLFVKLKTCLLVEQKDLDEKIRFHEEQLERLQDSIPA